MLAVAYPPQLCEQVIDRGDLDPQPANESDPHERQLDQEIIEVLASVRRLLIKYKMYNKSSESPVVSGGLQQFIINKLKKRGDQEKSLTQRLKALYMRDETVQFTSGTEGEEMSMFDCLPVSSI